MIYYYIKDKNGTCKIGKTTDWPQRKKLYLTHNPLIEEIGLIETDSLEVDKMFYSLPAIYVRTVIGNEWAYQNPAIDVLFFALQNIQKESSQKAEDYLKELQTISDLVIKYQSTSKEKEYIESQLEKNSELTESQIITQPETSMRTKITEAWRNKLSDGEILSFIDDPKIKVVWKSDQNKIEYNGKLYSLSTLAQSLKRTSYPLQGSIYWKNSEGVLVAKL